MKLSYSYTPPSITTEILFDSFPSLSPYIAVVDSCISLERITHFGTPLHVIVLDAGEQAKSRDQKALLEDKLLELQAGADAHLVAIGSGTILDLVGFTASTYCRGIRYSAIPTTLLGMVDAAIGGKNGLNVAHAKNWIGTIYQPEHILIDINFLTTLPYLELQNGCVEMAKHALIDPTICFREELSAILSGDKEITLHAIGQSIAVKLRVVEESIKHPEARHLLNLGHTIGHAIETLEEFQVSHGQAVAMGLMAEARLFHDDCSDVDSLIQAIGLPLKLRRKYSMKEWERALLTDKKNEGAHIRFVDLKQQKCVSVDPAALEKVLTWVNDTFGVA